MRASSRSVRKLLAAAVATGIAVGGLASPAYAVDTQKTWTGGSSASPGLWSDTVPVPASNWNPPGPPASSPTLRLEFPQEPERKAMSNDVGPLELAGLDFTGAGYSLTGAKLTLTGGDANRSIRTTSGETTLSVPLAIGDVVTTDGPSALTLSGPIDGTGFPKQGPGTMKLTATNTFTGALTIAAGAVQVTNAGALGADGGNGDDPAANRTIVQPGGALEIAFPFSQGSPFTEPLRLSGAGANAARGALHLGTPSGTTPTITGPVELVAQQGAPAAVVGIDGGLAAFASDALRGDGGLTKIGEGTLALLGGNSYTGPTTVAAGTLRLTGDDPGGVPGALVVGDGAGTDRVETLGNARFGGPVTVNLGGVLDLMQFNVAPTAVTLNGGRIVGADILTLGGNWTTSVPNGSPQDVNAFDGILDIVDAARTFEIGEGAPAFDARLTGTITGDGSITKTGDGTLLINGPVGVPVTVQAGGLAGFGEYAGNLTVSGGTLRPGQSPGHMTVGGGLTLGSGARLEIELGGTTAGSGYDQLAVDGAVDLANATLDVLPLFTSTGGDTFTIVANAGSDAVQGTFASLAEGATISAGSRRYSITYQGGDGNDVVLRDLGAVAGADSVTRLQGSDRIDTAIAASKSSYPTNDSAKTAVLARSTAFPDALGGAALAAAKDGPLLLTPETGLDARTRAELARALPSGATVYVLGGPQALVPQVDSELRNAGFTVRRLAGADRYATAVAIADEGLGNPSTLLLATGQNFPDALAGGAAAAKANGAVLLTEGSTVPAATRAYLDAHPTAVRYALGGPAARAVPDATAVSGADRYETAVAVARRFFTAPSVVGVASGVAFPDALSGGAHIGRLGGPILLATPSSLPAPVSTYLTENKAAINAAYVYGGPVAIAETVAAAVKTSIT